MKIGIVTTWHERGAAYVSRQYRDVLDRAGHETFVFARSCTLDKNNRNWDDPKVHWASKTLTRDWSEVPLSEFKRWLHDTGVSVVLFNEQRTNWPMAICSELGVKTIAYVDYYKKETVNDFAIYDGLVCNTRRHYSVFDWHPQCLYVPWGTDTSLFRPSENWPSLVNPGVVTFFHSAGCAPTRKGTDRLLRAFAKVKGPARLVIHAQKDIFAEIPDLKSVADSIVNDGRLRIISETIPAPGAYSMGDVYVYPSRLDGIGLTVCEAMSCGLPVIVPDEAPMNEFPDVASGVLVPVAGRSMRTDGYYWPMCNIDENSLMASMEALAGNPENVVAMKRSAREHALRDRSWEKNSRAIPSFFEGLNEAHDASLVHRFRSRPPCVFLHDLAKNAKKSIRTALGRLKS